MIITPHLGIELTQRCNLDCRHCFRGESCNVDISKEILEKVFDEVKMVVTLDLSGGEVFLAYEQLKMLLEIAEEKECQILSCSMLINGTVYDQRIYDLLNKYFGDNYQIGISNDDFHDKSIERIYSSSTQKSNNPGLYPCNLSEVKENMRLHIFNEHSIGFQRVSHRLIENGRAVNVDTPRKKYEIEGYYYSKYKEKHLLVGPIIFIGADGYISDINSDISKRKDQSIGNILDTTITSSVLNGGIEMEFNDIDEFYKAMEKREYEFATHQGDHLVFENNKMSYTSYEPDTEYIKEFERINEIWQGFFEACEKGQSVEYLSSLDFSSYPHDLSQIEHDYPQNK